MHLTWSSLRTPLLLLVLWIAGGVGAMGLLHLVGDTGPGTALFGALPLSRGVPVSFLVRELGEIVLVGALAIPLLSTLVAYLRRPAVARRIVGAAAPGDIGAIRALVCAILLISVLWEDVASTAALPREMLRPMGVMQLFRTLPGFEWLLVSPAALHALEWATGLLLFMGMIGWKTRIVLPLGALGYLLVGGILRQYAWFYHTGLIALYLLVVLSFMPAHHGRSVDRILRLRKGRRVVPDVPSLEYGWMRYALWATMAVPYVAAGLSKIRNGGITWWEASNFKFILFQSTLRPMEFEFDLSLLLARAPDALFALLAVAALAGEIFYGLVLFSRRARWILPALMLLMHLGILFLQNILFFDLILLQAIFFDFRPLARATRRLCEQTGISEIWSRQLQPLAPSDDDEALTENRAWLAPGSWRLASAVAITLSVFWIFRVEFYPFTGMQMFSQKRTEPVVYERVLAHLESGQNVRAPIERSIRAMSDSRYRRVLQMAFDDQRESVTSAFLDAVQTRWNGSAATGTDRIVGFEVQRWEWHYLQEPAHPTYGRIVARRVFSPDGDQLESPGAPATFRTP